VVPGQTGIERFRGALAARPPLDATTFWL
jgi:hypothetical protein